MSKLIYKFLITLFDKYNNIIYDWWYGNRLKKARTINLLILTADVWLSDDKFSYEMINFHCKTQKLIDSHCLVSANKIQLILSWQLNMQFQWIFSSFIEKLLFNFKFNWKNCLSIDPNVFNKLLRKAVCTFINSISFRLIYKFDDFYNRK